MKEKEILTDLQKQVLESLFRNEWFRRHFYLTGGTALSGFYYRHRLSEDLDFFSHDVTLDSLPTLMRHVAKELGLTIKQTQISPSFMRYQAAGSLQIDLVADVSYRVDAPQLIGNFMVDCVKNIAVNKVGCILGRFEPKDFVDLYFLLENEKYDIFELMELGQNKDGGLEPFVWANLLADVEKMEILPRMVKPLNLKVLKKYFLNLRNRILDRIKPVP